MGWCKHFRLFGTCCSNMVRKNRVYVLTYSSSFICIGLFLRAHKRFCTNLQLPCICCRNTVSKNFFRSLCKFVEKRTSSIALYFNVSLFRSRSCCALTAVVQSVRIGFLFLYVGLFSHVTTNV